MLRRAHGCVVLACVVAALVAGCGGGEAIEVTHWTLTTPGGTTRVTVPADLEVGDRPITYTLSTRVELPRAWRGRALSLSIPSLLAEARLHVDGELIPSRLTGGLDGYRERGSFVWTIPARLTTAEVLDLELVVAHRWTLSGMLLTTPRLARDPDGDAVTRFVNGFNTVANLLAIGFLTMVSITYGALFLLDRRRRDYGWSAFRCCIASVYMLHVLGVLVPLGPTAEVALILMLLVLAIASATLSSDHQFGIEHAPLVLELQVLGIVAVVLALSPFAMAHVIPLGVAIIAAGLGYETARMVALVRRSPRHVAALPNVLAWGFLAALAAPDMVYWLGLGEPLSGIRLGGVGLAGYSVLQFVAFSIEHMVSLRRTDRLNLELEHNLGVAESRKAEIESLNVELQRQIAERSRQLSDALGRLAAHVGGGTLEPGTVVDERYRIVRRIGAGAAGTVYECERVSDGRRYALKALDGNLDARKLARFAREAQLAAEIQCRHVVRIVDVEFASAGFVYLVMELVTGQSLHEHRERFGDTAWATEILRQLARGLVAVHGHGVVHRDLKPANVLLAPGEGKEPFRVVITDFGISWIAGEGTLDEPRADGATHDSQNDQATGTGAISMAALAADDEETGETRLSHDLAAGKRPGSTQQSARLTRTGFLVGTPAYMAPELARDPGAVTPAADIFSFSVMAWELITRERPYVTPAVFVAGKGPPPALDADALGATDPAIAALLLRGLDFDPTRRPSAAELHEALARG